MDFEVVGRETELVDLGLHRTDCFPPAGFAVESEAC